MTRKTLSIDVEAAVLTLYRLRSTWQACAAEWDIGFVQRSSKSDESSKLRYDTLWRLSVEGGEQILLLGNRRQIELWPRLQTRSFQIKAELHKAVDAAQRPEISKPIWRTGFDSLLVKLFDSCCDMWLHDGKQSTGWRDPAQVALRYAKFLEGFITEMCEHHRVAICSCEYCNHIEIVYTLRTKCSGCRRTVCMQNPYAAETDDVE